MTFPLVQFVAAPEVGARVLLDLNNDDHDLRLQTYPDAPSWDLGSPSLSGPIDASGKAWGPRRLTFDLAVIGPRAATKTVISRLARILARRRTWLLWQLDSLSAPVWFEIFASEPGGLNFESVYIDDRQVSTWEATLRLDASPWAIGELVTQDLGDLSNDPTTGGCRVELDPILGDAPTPLTITAEPSGDWGLRRVSMSVCSTEPEGQQRVGIWQASQFTANNGTGAVVASPSWPGNGYRTVTDSPTSSARRLVFTTSEPTLKPGRYAAYLLCGPTDGSGPTTFDVRLTIGDFSDALAGDWVRVVGPVRTGYQSWVPCGKWSLPVGVDQAVLNEDDILSALEIQVYARRVTGSNLINLGAVMLVPLDGPGVVSSSTTTSRWLLPWASSPLILDGESETVYSRAADGGPVSVTLPELRGIFPTVVPGATNTLTVLQQTSDIVDSPDFEVANGDDVRESTALSASYRPRYLWMPSNAVEVA